jgi:ERCC4-type nuclease
MYTVDSREKKNQHILDYFDRHNIEYEIRKLDTADYWNDENPNVVIDRKRNLNEVAQNLCSPDSSRFWREIRRSCSEKKNMIILVEHGSNIKSLADVSGWSSKYTKLSGSRLQAEMYRVGIAYNIQFEFCSKRSTGKRIMELLTER